MCLLVTLWQISTERFTDLGKLNFPIWFGFRLEPISNTSSVPKILFDSKVVKINPKTIIWLCYSKSVTLSVDKDKGELYSALS